MQTRKAPITQSGESNRNTSSVQKSAVPEETIDFLLGWDLTVMREDLRELMECFFMYYENPSKDFRDSIYNSYCVLSCTLKKLIVIQEDKIATNKPA